MRNVFVETENYQKFRAAMGNMEMRGADEVCLLVVDGRPGLGKTTILGRWAAQTGSIFVRAKTEWTPGWFLDDVLAEVQVQPKRSYEKRYQQVMQALTGRHAALELQGKPFALVIDEADHISRSRHIMETIRDLSDTGRIPIVLIGMGKIRDNLAAFAQITSRTQPHVRFEPASIADVRRFVDQVCEVPVADDLVAYVHRVTGGYNREIKEAIAVIERYGRRNRKPDGAAIALADMVGQTLLTDRNTGNPIVVREALS